MFSKYGWFVFLILYFLFVAYWVVGLSGQISSLPDVSFYFKPLKKIVVDFLGQGSVPLWNPYVACGMPLLADWQSACCYPFTWAGAWIDFSKGAESVSLLHELLAFAGFCLWLRLNRVGRLWSVLGAMGFAGSAHMVICWGYNSFQASLTWVPWVFWSAQSALEQGGVHRWIRVILIFSFQLLAGYPPFSFYTFIFLGVWAVWHKTGIGANLRLMLCGLAALLVTSAQWLPFLEFLSNGQRTLGVEYPYHFCAEDFRRIINPFQGQIGSLEFRGMNQNAPYNPYTGIAALVLLIWSFFKPFSEKINFWKWSSLFILIWMAGHNGPANWLLPSGLLNAFEPAKAAFLFVFCAITASAHQGNGYLNSKKKNKSVFILIIAFVWAMEVLVLPFRIRQYMPDPYLDSSAVAAAQAVRNAAGEGRVLQVMTSLDYSLLDQEDLPSRIRDSVHMMEPNVSSVFGIRTLAGHLSLVADGFMNLVRYGNKAYPYRGRLFDIAGVRVFICKRKMPLDKYESIPAGEKNILNINRKALPSLRLVDGAHYFENRPAVLEATTLETANVEKEVYLEKGLGGFVTALSPARRRLVFDISGENKTSRCSPQRALWRGETQPGSYVVFNETFFPGWKAWLDGEPVPIYRAYGQFMAVRVDQGSVHQINFGYEPDTFKMGLFISICSVSVLIGLGLAGIFRIKNSLV